MHDCQLTVQQDTKTFGAVGAHPVKQPKDQPSFQTHKTGCVIDAKLAMAHRQHRQNRYRRGSDGPAGVFEQGKGMGWIEVA